MFLRDCVFSAVRSYKLRWRREDNEKIVKKFVPVNFNYRQRPRRQDFKQEFIEAGMFFFTNRKLLDEGLFQNEKCVFFIFNILIFFFHSNILDDIIIIIFTFSCDIVEIKDVDSLEIDTQYDLELARLIYKNFKM